MKSLSLALSLLLVALNAAFAADRPNVIVIMADDFGYENLSCHGSEMYSTPHLDALAASGMRFDHAHAQPICTPSRVQIMTGIHNNRNYVKFGVLDPEATTSGHLMKEGGYRTVIGGKWQLAGGMEAPKHFGFEQSCLWQLTRRPSRYPNPGLEIDGEEKDFKNGEFGPHLVTDYLCDYLEARKADGEPFFMYYPMIAPHWPFVPTPGSPDWDPTMWRDAKGEPGGYKDQKYWDLMVTLTDDMVGKLVAKLDELEMRENTLVIFTGDNGTYTGITSELNGQTVKGGKGSTIDTGTHVPFIVSWPDAIEGGQVVDDLVDFSDVLPTVTDAAGIEVPAELGIDDVSLAPLFKGETRDKPYLYCWYERHGERAKASQHVRNQRYKLYASGKFFDTETDPDEKKDLLKADLPDDLASVHKALDAALQKHLAVTKEADPLQEAKRKELKR